MPDNPYTTYKDSKTTGYINNVEEMLGVIPHGSNLLLYWFL